MARPLNPGAGQPLSQPSRVRSGGEPGVARLLLLAPVQYPRAPVTPRRPSTPFSSTSSPRRVVIILGIVLFIVGLVAKIAVLETIGVILVAVAVGLVLGLAGRAVGGRRHYW